MGLERNTIRLARRAATAAVALVAMSLSAGASLAADKHVLEEVEETSVEFGTGWYIRGDLGFNVSGVERNRSRISEADSTFSDEENIGASFFVGGAVGYKFAPKLRGDLGFQYFSNEDSRRTRLVSSSRCPGQVNETRTVGYIVTPATPAIPATPPVIVNGVPVTTGTPGVPGTPEVRTPIRETGWFDTTIENCSEHDEIQHDAQLFSANAYYDFDPVGRFRPFVGLGLGVARVNYRRNTDVVCIPGSDSYRCSNDDNPFPPAPGPDGTFVPPQPGEPLTRPVARSSGTSYHLAGTIAAGVSYQLSKNTHLDASYAFTHIANNPVLDASNGLDGADLDGNLHQVKIGLRYELW